MANLSHKFIFLLSVFFVIFQTGCKQKTDYYGNLVNDEIAMENSLKNKNYDEFSASYNAFKNHYKNYINTQEFSIYFYLGSDTTTSTNTDQIYYKSFINAVDNFIATVEHNLSGKKIDFYNSEILSSFFELQTGIDYLQILDHQNAAKTNQMYLSTIMIISFLIVLLSIFLFFTIKKYENELDDSEQLTTYSIIMFDGIEKERKRFSKEIHDTVLQDIRAIQLETEQKLPDNDKIGELSKRAIIKIRQICSNHIPPELLKLTSKDGFSFLPTILNYCTDFFANTNINFSSKIQDDIETGTFSVKQNLHLFRIIQEALNNIIHHSQANSVSLLIRNSKSDDDQRLIIFIIKDDGIGFNSDILEKNNKIKKSDGNHFGLQNMQERCKILNANLKIFSEPGEGTQVILEVPIN